MKGQNNLTAARADRAGEPAETAPVNASVNETAAKTEDVGANAASAAKETAKKAPKESKVNIDISVDD